MMIGGWRRAVAVTGSLAAWQTAASATVHPMITKPLGSDSDSERGGHGNASAHDSILESEYRDRDSHLVDD